VDSSVQIPQHALEGNSRPNNDLRVGQRRARELLFRPKWSGPEDAWRGSWWPRWEPVSSGGSLKHHHTRQRRGCLGPWSGGVEERYMDKPHSLLTRYVSGLLSWSRVGRLGRGAKMGTISARKTEVAL
jgi:hypothetical protein